MVLQSVKDTLAPTKNDVMTDRATSEDSTTGAGCRPLTVAQPAKRAYRWRISPEQRAALNRIRADKMTAGRQAKSRSVNTATEPQEAPHGTPDQRTEGC